MVAVAVIVIMAVTVLVSVIRPGRVRRVCVAVVGLVIVRSWGSVGHERALRDQCRDYAAYAGKVARCADATQWVQPRNR